MRAGAVMVMLALGLGCRRESKSRIIAAPERVPSRPQPSPGPSGTMVDRLVGYAGEVVTVEGQVVKGALAHMTKTITGKVVQFVLLEGGNLEIVAYLPSLPTCPGSVLITGKVIVVVGKATGPGGGGDYAETQLDAERWVCR